MTAPTLNPDAQAAAQKPATATDIPCPPWCDHDCEGWVDDIDGTRYHAADYVQVDATEEETGQKGISVSLTRLDDLDGPGTPQVHLLTGTDRILNDDWRLTPADARKLAAALLNAADVADSGQPAEVSTPAHHLRVGDQFLTPDGWQNVIGLMVFSNSDYVAVFTPERPGDTDGWPYTLADTVTARLSGVNR